MGSNRTDVQETKIFFINLLSNYFINFITRIFNTNKFLNINFNNYFIDKRDFHNDNTLHPVYSEYPLIVNRFLCNVYKEFDIKFDEIKTALILANINIRRQ
jgi:hypothetical protein